MSGFFADTKQAGIRAADKVEAGAEKVKTFFIAPLPAYSDIAKPTNDLLGKDFYHVAAVNLELKTKAPNGVNYTAKGKSTAHDKPLIGSLEGKYADKPSGIYTFNLSQTRPLGTSAWSPSFTHFISFTPRQPIPSQYDSQEKQYHPSEMHVLMRYRAVGTTGTLAWSTLNVLDAKIEMDNNIAKGMKAEALASFKPDTNATAAKLNLYFKQPSFHLRAFTDLLKGPTATVDAVIGHEGFVVGGEAGYDVQKAAVTRYAAAVGYSHPSHNVAVTATNNLSVFSASYYNRVNSQVEVGAKAAWDSKSSSTVGMEVAAKYIIDPLSFAKGKLNDRGIAALAYNTRVNGGLTFGIGASFDTQKLNEASHQVGMHLAFEG